MTAVDPASITLPLLRPDVEVLPGPEDHDGTPTYVIHDPVKGQFHKLRWAESEIVWRLGRFREAGRMLADLTEKTTLRLTLEDITGFCKSLVQARLTAGSGVGQTEMLLAEKAATREGVFKWLVRHYLYIRIPLIHPDRALDRLLPLVRWLGSKQAFAFYALALIVGLLNLLPRMDLYWKTVPRFFTPAGVAQYVLAIIAIKLVHEFSHAFTAKSLGVRVPTMGVALMVFCPVAFCDVTDGWKLSDRRKRLLISSAGLLAELIIAALSLFMWGLCKPGFFQGLFFVFSSATLISTLLINLNPAMRFDGYYILSDLWGIDNLQQHSFSMCRWALRKHLLGMNAEPPEAMCSTRRLLGMIAYSLYAWAYRFGLYLGIAVLVYLKFPKIIGITLFAVEIAVFLVLPVVNEVKDLYRSRELLRMNPRMLVSLGMLALLVLWVVLPLPRNLALPAVVTPAEEQVIYCPSDGVIKSLSAERDRNVSAGEIIAEIDSPELRDEIAQLTEEEKIVSAELLRLRTMPGDTSGIPEASRQLERVNSRLRSLREKRKQNIVSADISGTVYQWDANLREGLYVRSGEVFGRIANPHGNIVTAFLPEEYVADIAAGDEAVFIPADGLYKITGTVIDISPLREETLDFPALSSAGGGDLPITMSRDGRMFITDSYYCMSIRFDEEQSKQLKIRQSGRVWARTAWRSYFAGALRQAWRVLVKESGF